MADNSNQGGSDTIATDDVTTLNGAASTGVKVQRVKVGFGSDNFLRDVDADNPLPITGTVGLVPAAATWGQAVAAVAGSTTTLVSIASSSAGMRITGIIASGTGDGYFAVQVSGLTVFAGRTRSTLPTLAIMLPNGIAPATGSLVTLKVTNESGSTADYDATLLGT